MKVITVSTIVLGALIGLFGIFLFISTVNDYRPDSEIVLFSSSKPGIVDTDSTMSLIIWNIGYAGLDASMDFFYDGGEQVRPEKARVKENLNGIASTLQDYNAFDFILLQEVDKKSKRSYRFDEVTRIKEVFPGYYSSFGLNYRVWFVPVPVRQPMGSVKSGLQTLSSRVPRKVVRHNFPGNYRWPLKLYMLDRCFMVSYFPTTRGNEFVLVNTHNSAYDDGTLREGQMDYMRDFLLEEYAKGNYVVVGGDWNQSPPDFQPLFDSERFDRDNFTMIEFSYPEPGWEWVYDASVPTNRRVKTAYDPLKSPVTQIDQFLISPNVNVVEVRGIEQEFRYSDHQPVTMVIELD